MAKDNYGYVQIGLSLRTKNKLGSVVKKLVPEKMLYKSKVVPYIRGDVTDVTHLTVCYGIKNSDLPERLKESSLEIKELTPTEITNVGFTEGYQDEYFSIYAVPEIEPLIIKLDHWIRENNKIADISKEFVPHITLCYVKNSSDFSANDLVQKLRPPLIGTTIEFEGVYFYRPETEERVLLA